MKEIDIELEIEDDEDENEDEDIHVYCDGNRVIMLNDEKLDKLSETKKDLEDRMEGLYEDHKKLKAWGDFFDGAIVSYAVGSTLNLVGGVFQDLMLNVAWVGAFGVLAGLKYRNGKRIKENNDTADRVSEKLDEAEKAYDDCIEEVAAKNIETENFNVGYMYR